MANPPDIVWTSLQKRPDTCELMVLNGFLKEMGLPPLPEDIIISYAGAGGLKIE